MAKKKRKLANFHKKLSGFWELDSTGAFDAIHVYPTSTGTIVTFEVSEILIKHTKKLNTT